MLTPVNLDTKTKDGQHWDEIKLAVGYVKRNKRFCWTARESGPWNGETLYPVAMLESVLNELGYTASNAR